MIGPWIMEALLFGPPRRAEAFSPHPEPIAAGQRCSGRTHDLKTLPNLFDEHHDDLLWWNRDPSIAAQPRVIEDDDPFRSRRVSLTMQEIAHAPHR